MATILTHSTEIPDAGDSGNIFCPMLERNWTRYDAHDHSGGTKGTQLDPAAALSKQTDTAAAGSWALDANDVYKQEITLPSGYTYSTTYIECRIDDEKVNLRHEEGSASNKFYLYCNDNSKDVELFYL